MKRKAQLTPEKTQSIFRSLCLMKICLDMAIVENSYYLDVNFKNPVIHNKLNTATQNIEYVSNELGKKFIVPTEASEDITFVLHEFMQVAQSLNKIELEELIKGIKEMKGLP